MSTLNTTQVTLEHFLRSLVYRFKHVTSNVPEGFGNFDPGWDIRNPSRIVRHMSNLLRFTQSQLDGTTSSSLEPLLWEEELVRFINVAAELEQSIHKSLEVNGSIGLDQLWRGPLTDAMTHIGQLAMLRRLSGSPIEDVRYWQVKMPPLNDYSSE